MSEITIPPEAVEAAVLAIFRTRYSFDPVFPQDDHQWKLSRAYAIAAIRAALAAWPGVVKNYSWDASHGRIILPLPQENGDG